MPKTDAELAEEQLAEYSAYVAVQAIDIGGARAFNPGDPVPASHVKRGVVSEDAVAKTTTKAGQAVIAETTGTKET